MRHESMFDIGDELKDRITGFTGIVMAICFYSTGCTHYGLVSQQLKESGEVADWIYLDSARLIRTKGKAVSFDIDEEKPSGSFPNPPQQ